MLPRFWSVLVHDSMLHFFSSTQISIMIWHSTESNQHYLRFILHVGVNALLVEK